MGNITAHTNRQPEAEHRAQPTGGQPGHDPVNSYFECITACSIDDGECVTQCVEVLRGDD